MKRWKMLLVVFTLALACTACGGNEDDVDAEVETTAEEVQSDNPEPDEIKTYTLSSETEDISIEIGISGVFQETEYISESWLALEIPGSDEDSSTQLMMYLEADESIDMKASMLEEVNYLMSANTDDWNPIDEVEAIVADNREWSYISYELEGLQGFKMWAELENGTVLAGTIENVGNVAESIDIDELVRQMDGTIAVD